MQKIRHQRKRTRRIKDTVKKSLLLFASFILILSPFSSLGNIGYAEGYQVEEQEQNIEPASEVENFATDPLEETDEETDGEENDSSSEGGVTLEEGDATEDDNANSILENESENSVDSKIMKEEIGEAKEASATKEEKLKEDPKAQLFTIKGLQPLASSEDEYEWVVNTDETTVTITGYTGTDTDITIPDTLDGKGVTVIGADAFREKKLTSVTLPDSVTTINARAFWNNDLENVTIPDSVTRIHNQAFHQNKLTSITIPSSVTSIGNNPFSGNPNIKFVVNGNNFQTGENNNFLKVNDNLIAGNSTGEIPNDITTIGAVAFQHNDLRNVTIPDSVTSIGSSAFLGNDLENITLSKNVTNVTRNAFQANNLSQVTVHNSQTNLGDNAFANNQLNPADLTIIGHDSSTAKTYAEENNHTFQSFSLDYGWSDNPDGTVTITSYTGTDTDITIPDTLDGKTVTEIGVRAFESKGLTSVVIPQSVTSIRAFAFWGNNLTGTLDLTSENLVEIAERAFEQNNLEKVKIGKNVERISRNYTSSPFNSNENLETIIVDSENETFEDMGGRAIYRPDVNLLVQGTNQGFIPEGTTRIQASAFRGFNLNEINIPHSVNRIDRYAFAANKLTEINLPNSIEYIDEFAFSGNQNTYTEIHLPESLNHVGWYSFNGRNLENVYVYNPNITIRNNAFNPNLEPPEDLTIYGYANSTAEAYANDADGSGKKHTFVPFSEVVVDDASLPIQLGQFIGVKDSDDNLIASLKIPNAVQPIDALDNATLEVKSVDPIVATGLAEAGAVLDFTFRDTSGDEIEVSGDFELSLLVDDATEDIAIYHQKGEDDWEKIGGNVAGNFITATVNDFSAYGVFNESDYEWTVNTDGTTVTITNYKGTDKDITIPDTLDGKTVTVIGEDAFLNKGLNSVVIPSTVTTIGYRAFMNNNLENITIPEGVKTLSSFVFVNNGLKSVTIPASLTSVERNPFAKNPEIKFTVSGNTFESGENGNYLRHGDTLISGNNSGEIPNNVTEIGSSAFLEVDLVVITIPDNVEIIGDEAYSSNNITNVFIPDSVTTIQRSAFTYNDLTTIVIPENVENIGYNAFGRNNLTQVTIHNSQTHLANNVFFGNQTNPADLTIEGYANSTAETVASDNGFTFVPFSEVVVDGSALPVKPGMTVTVKDASDDEIAKLETPNTVEPNDALDNATLEVRTVDPVSATGLAEAGAVLDFTFRNASGDVIEVSGDFELSLLVNDATKDIAIYHEISPDDWKSKGGTVAGNFITATVNDFSAYGVFYEIVLEVDSIETLADISVDYGTELNNVPLPTDVEVTLDDSTTRSITVSWDNGNPAYDGTQSGSYVFTGTLNLPAGVTNPSSLEATVTVEVGEPYITGIETLAIINVANGTDLSIVPLPNQVEVTLNDGSKQNITVNWDNGNPVYNGSQSGLYAFSGTLALPAGVTNPNSLEAGVTVIVGELTIEQVAAQADIDVVNGTDVNDIGLSEEVEVTLNDGSNLMLQVTWDGGNPAYDAFLAGSYAFAGTLALPAGVTNPNNLAATVTVNVGKLYITDVATISNIDVDYGTDRGSVSLPTEIEVTLNDGSKRNLSVTWDNGIPAYNGSQSGSYDFSGTLALPTDVINPADHKATVVVVVGDEPVPVVDKDVLKDLIDEAERYDEDDYTLDSYSNLLAVLAAAHGVFEDDSATNEQVANALQQLEQALNDLVEVAEEQETPDGEVEEESEISTDEEEDPTATETDSTPETSKQVKVTAGSGDSTDDLPNTATNIFNIIAIATGLLILGMITLFITRRKRTL